MKKYLFFILLNLSGWHSLWAQTTVTFGAAADNTLYENATGSVSNGAGDHFFSGTTTSGAIRRGVIRFDLSSLPAGITLTSATLTLSMDQTISGAQDVGIHRVSGTWGEGTSFAGGGGGGGTASTANDATWIHRFFPDTTWTTAGGDFDPAATATVTVGSIGSYSWTGTQVTADVQDWYANPATNFGWLLKGNESAVQTAKRFVSREFTTAASRPQLEITYTLPCVLPALNSLTLSADTICAGTAVNLAAAGPLNDATAWWVYSGLCGGNLIDSAANGIFSLSPVVTTTYFVRGEGGCVTGGTCDSVRVVVLPKDTAAFAYSSGSYCQTAPIATPAISGTRGGTFSSTPAGLALDPVSGQINPSSSTVGLTYDIKYLTQGICPDSLVRTISIVQSYLDSVDARICAGDTFILGNQLLTESGTYSQLFPTDNGCDSLVVVSLSVEILLGVSYVDSICAGDSYVFGQQILTEPGSYTEVFTVASGCQYTVSVNLRVDTLDLTVIGLLNDPNILQAVEADAIYQWLDCSNNFQPLPGETNAQLIVTRSGTYAVIITKGSCSDTSECIPTVVIGIDAQATPLELRISPNPTRQNVQIALDQSFGHLQARLFDLQGRMVTETENMGSDSLSLNMENLPAGLYLVQVQAGDKIAWGKVRKE